MAMPNVFLQYVQYDCAHLRQNLSKNFRFEVQSNFEWAILDVVKEKGAVKPVWFGKAFDAEWGKIPHSKSGSYYSSLVYLVRRK